MRATASCERCLLAICEVCSSTRGGGTFCVRCVRDQRRARERRLALLCTGVVVAAVATPLVVRALRAPVEARPGTRTVEKAASVVEKTAPVLSQRSTELSAAVDKEPCDRGKIVELCESLLRDVDARVREANEHIEEERNRLAALMSELAHSVINTSWPPRSPILRAEPSSLGSGS